jgi:hypothetical protein
MTNTFPVVLLLDWHYWTIGSIGSFYSARRLRHFRVGEKPPASHARLSVEQTEKDYDREADSACQWLVHVGRALFFAWLKNSK